MNRIAVAFTAALATVCLSPLAAVSAEWPNRAVRIVSPASAGGTSDTFARILAERFGELFKERFFVENRAGAGGLIGAAAVANSEPDGHSLVISAVAYTVIAPSTSANPPFDPQKNFSHIAYIGGPPNVFVAHPSLGVKNMDELLALAKQKGMLDYVSPGVGTLGHMMAERFADEAKIKLQHIPNKGGATAMVDLVSGTVGLGSMTWSSALQYIRNGQVIPIAVSSENRLPEFPNVPTLKELGYPNLVATIWFGLSGPAGMPREVVQKVNKATIETLQLPAVRERLERDAIETKFMTPEEYTAFHAKEVEAWGPVAKRLLQQK
jgi:tripartite-type tricarboxylate transporter receptor subunit TctC